MFAMVLVMFQIGGSVGVLLKLYYIIRVVNILTFIYIRRNLSQEMWPADYLEELPSTREKWE